MYRKYIGLQLIEYLNDYFSQLFKQGFYYVIRLLKCILRPLVSSYQKSNFVKIYGYFYNVRPNLYATHDFSFL